TRIVSSHRQKLPCSFARIAAQTVLNRKQIQRLRSPSVPPFLAWRLRCACRDIPSQTCRTPSVSQKERREDMLTVNTNTGAMIALQYLNQTNAQLQATQNAI